MENDREKKVFRAQAISTERRFLSSTERRMEGCSDEPVGGRR